MAISTRRLDPTVDRQEILALIGQGDLYPAQFTATVYRGCPVCLYAANHQIESYKHYHLRQCAHCGFVYVWIA